MVAGMFRNSGAFMGETLLAPTVSNKYGYYEDRRLGSLNIRLVEQAVEWPKFNRLIRRHVSPAAHVDQRAYWLAAPRRLRKVSPSTGDLRQMRGFAKRTPFCYKLPHFNVTLPAWRSVLTSDTRFIVVFRDPAKTVDSMLRDAHEVYDPPLAITKKWCLTSWERNYRRLLFDFGRHGEWLFLDYRQVASLEGVPAIEHFAETEVDSSEIDPGVSRAQTGMLSTDARLRRCQALYDVLRERARRDVALWSQCRNERQSSL